MLHFLQPVFAALVGAALFLFGLIHGIKLVPAAAAWRQVVVATPQLMSVGLFLVCVIMLLAGVAMLVTGIQSARRRFSQLRRLRLHSHPSYEDPDEQWR